jgi:hypothetical protein
MFFKDLKKYWDIFFRFYLAAWHKFGDGLEKGKRRKL